jgi:hypothetical protein
MNQTQSNEFWATAEGLAGIIITAVIAEMKRTEKKSAEEGPICRGRPLAHESKLRAMAMEAVESFPSKGRPNARQCKFREIRNDLEEIIKSESDDGSPVSQKSKMRALALEAVKLKKHKGRPSAKESKLWEIRKILEELV